MAQVLIMIVGGLLLLAAGAGLGYWFALVGRQRGRADVLQQELDDYRDEVNRHFATTADHFQTIGREYRALYQHMASGAESLCDPQRIDGRLPFGPQLIDPEIHSETHGETHGDGDVRSDRDVDTVAVQSGDPPAVVESVAADDADETPDDVLVAEDRGEKPVVEAPEDAAEDGEFDDTTPDQRARAAESSYDEDDEAARDEKPGSPTADAGAEVIAEESDPSDSRAAERTIH